MEWDWIMDNNETANYELRKRVEKNEIIVITIIIETSYQNVWLAAADTVCSTVMK